MSKIKTRDVESAKPPNIYDVAREAGVSIFTVSSVVNKKRRIRASLQRRVEAAIQKLHYRPNLLARGLANSKTHTIGVIVADIGNPFFPMIVRGAEDAAQKEGYNILLCNTDNEPAKEEGYLDLLLSKRVDGILLCKAPGPFPAHLEKMLNNTHIPIGLMMRTCRGINVDSVLTDDFLGAFEATSHLARLGYRRIGFVGGPMNVSNGRARWRGYCKALEDLGISYDSNLMVEGDYRIDSGYRAGLSLLPKVPDAVCVVNYMMMVGFMKAAQEMNLRCPEDFGLVSFDDYPWLGCFHPRMTTIDLPKYEVGVISAQLLIERIHGKKGPPVIRKLIPRLIVRESCGFKPRSERLQGGKQRRGNVRRAGGGFAGGAQEV
jgi:LacI family transcriptional regulator